MKIQLPTDKKERNKILFMIALCGVVILYGLIMFVFVPYRSRVRTDRERLAELEDQLWQADREIRQIPHNRERNIEILNYIIDVSESQEYILRPRLGNYLLVAESLLEQAANEAGVQLRNIREASSPPSSQDANDREDLPALAPYNVTFSVHAGMHDLLRFVHTLQQANPYLTIANLTMSAGSDNSQSIHEINIFVQLPVWKHVDRPERLQAERISAEEQ